jgi:alanine dehydrogenase
MRIGVPAETKPGERRVALVPRDIALLSGDGHDVSVQGGAGLGTGFSDDGYRRAGARVVNADSAWDGEMIVKVKGRTPEMSRSCRRATLRAPCRGK